MELTRKERLILANQYLILEKLYPEAADYYKRNREIIENGYELMYSWVGENVYTDVLSIDACKEVLDILDMFRALKRTYTSLKDKSEIKEKHAVEFRGFDGNDGLEVRYLSFARFFCSMGRYEELEKEDGFNSHFPALEMYRRMLKEWKSSKNQFELTKEDLIRITKASIHPSNR